MPDQPQEVEVVIRRRLKKGDTIVYPYTEQELVIGLQKTIKDKLPIVSATQPTSDYVKNQVWIETRSEDNTDYQSEWHRVPDQQQEEDEWHRVADEPQESN